MSDVVFLVDGVPGGSVPATDSSVLRGDGCFEAVRCYGGRLFRVDEHLDRLERSAAALGLTVPARSSIMEWMTRAVEGYADRVVRVVLTRGGAVPGIDPAGVCVVVSHPVPRKTDGVRLWPVPAPWHPAGRVWELAGVKTISYAPNLAASRRAEAEGATDALLISDAGVVLEGPTFSVGWVANGRILTPALSLGILDSITRRAIAEIRPDLEETEATLESLLAADEIFVMSTVQEVAPVKALGDRVFPAGPVTDELVQRFAELVEQLATSAHPR